MEVVVSCTWRKPSQQKPTHGSRAQAEGPGCRHNLTACHHRHVISPTGKARAGRTPEWGPFHSDTEVQAPSPTENLTAAIFFPALLPQNPKPELLSGSGGRAEKQVLLTNSRRTHPSPLTCTFTV